MFTIYFVTQLIHIYFQINTCQDELTEKFFHKSTYDNIVYSIFLLLVGDSYYSNSVLP